LFGCDSSRYTGASVGEREMSFFEWVVLGNTVQSWLRTLLVTAAVLVSLRIAERMVIRRLAAFAKGTETDMDDYAAAVGAKTKLYLLGIVAARAGSLLLALPQQLSQWLGTAALLALLVQLAIWGDGLVVFWVGRYQEEYIAKDASRVTTVKALGVVFRVIILAVILLLALDNIPGVQASALLGSLGISGIAVALAVQSVLADLFASLSIRLDRPFVTGDYIVLGDHQGTVEHIGLKSTRIRSVSGEQLIVSNNDLLGSRIRNYGRMTDRRVVFSVGVSAETPSQKLEKIPSIIQEIIEAQGQTRFDRTHFKEYGDFALQFEVVYHVRDPSYRLHADIRQAINLAILKRFEEEGIGLPYPTQTVYVRREE